MSKWIDVEAEVRVEMVIKIIQPERVPFISYPYEWSFGQLKDAALATLSIQRARPQVGNVAEGCQCLQHPVRARQAYVDRYTLI